MSVEDAEPFDQDSADWRRSTYCSHGNCVEVLITGTAVAVRDSELRGDGPVLTFDRRAWTDFLTSVISGEIHRPG